MISKVDEGEERDKRGNELGQQGGIEYGIEKIM